MEEFARNLKNLRKAAGYTQKELSSLLGLTASGYASWEQDVSEPSLCFLKKLTELFEIDYNELLQYGAK